MKRLLLIFSVLATFFPVAPFLEASQVLVNPKFLVFDDNGDPMGGCIYTYKTGTNDPKATYSNKTLTTIRTNPIQANSRGEAGPIYLDGVYRIILGDPNDAGDCPAAPGVVEWTQDNVEGIGSTILTFTLLSDYASFHSAIATIGATPTELWVDEDFALTAHETIPLTLKLRWISPANTCTLGAFNLTFPANYPTEDWPSYQLFNQAGAGVVSGLGMAKPEWWGRTQNGTVDDAPMIQTALNALTSGGKISFHVGTYLLNSGLTVATDGIILEGESPRATILKVNHAGIGITIGPQGGGDTYADDVIISRIAFIDGDTNPSTFIKVAKALNPQINSCSFVGATATYAIDNQISYGLKINDTSFKDFQGTGLFFRSEPTAITYWTEKTTVNGCDFSGVDIGPAVNIQGGAAHQFSNCVFESDTVGALLLDAASGIQIRDISISSCFFESNTNYDIKAISTVDYMVNPINVYGSFFYSVSASPTVLLGTYGMINLFGTTGNLKISGDSIDTQAMMLGSFGFTLLGDMRAMELANQSPEGSLIKPMTFYRSYKTVKAGTYAWTLSGSGAGEYYLRTIAGANTGLQTPANVYQNNVVMAGGTVGALAVSQWAWADNDALGYSTVYVRLSDSTDPDTKADGYVCMLCPTWGLDTSGRPMYRVLYKSHTLFPDNDPTPDVSGGNEFRCNYSNPATIISDFRNGVSGQIIHIYWTAATTVDFTGTTLKGHNGADWVTAEFDAMTCFKGETNWYCDVQDNTP